MGFVGRRRDIKKEDFQKYLVEIHFQFAKISTRVQLTNPQLQTHHTSWNLGNQQIFFKMKLFIVITVLLAIGLVSAAKKASAPDPKECEVCISNLERIDKLLTDETRNNKESVREAIGKHCTKSGFGSEWKPNPALTSAKDVKMCYYFEPIKEAISVPFATGMPKDKVCKRLKKENPEICEVKYRKCFSVHHIF